MKEPVILRVAPDKKLERWNIFREGRKQPQAKGLSKSGAIKRARKWLARKACPGVILIHKTRFIIERSLSHSPA